jgi:hypothetical protein
MGENERMVAFVNAPGRTPIFNLLLLAMNWPRNEEHEVTVPHLYQAALGRRMLDASRQHGHDPLDGLKVRFVVDRAACEDK